MAKATQNERVLAYIQEFGEITQLDALKDLGCMRLASRVSDLRRQGHNIVGDTVAARTALKKLAISSVIGWAV
jgi:hypothetical protein